MEIIEFGWELEIILYLYFLELGGGAFIVSTAADFSGDVHKNVIARLGAYLALIAVILGIVFVALDVRRQVFRFLNMFTTLTSIMMWGTIFLFVFLPPVLITALTWLSYKEDKIGIFLSKIPVINKIVDLFQLTRGQRLAVEVFGSFMAILAVGYAGVLFCSIAARPFWYTQILFWILFVATMSDGVVGVGVMTALAPRLSPKSEKVSTKVLSGLEKIDTPLLLITTALLAVQLALTSAPTEINAILRGGLMLPFWIGVVGIGIVLPLILASYVKVLEKREAPHEKVYRLMLVTFSLVLIGALLLRYVLIVAGQVIG